MSTECVCQDIEWEKSYGGKHSEYLYDAISTPDYGFLLAGSSLSNKGGNKSDDSQGNYDYWLWKMDEHGGEEWQRSYGGSGSDILNCIKPTNDGGYILVGTSDSNRGGLKKDNSVGMEDIWILKINAKGVEQWQKTVGGTSSDRATSILATRDGGYLVGGSSSSSKVFAGNGGASEHRIVKQDVSRGGMDYWVLKLDSKGNMEWQRTFGGLYDDLLESVIETREGGYLLGGYSNSPASSVDGEPSDKIKDGLGGGDFWVVKINKYGIEEWQQSYGGEKDDHLQSMLQDVEGSFYMAGSTNSPNFTGGGSARNTDFILLKIDEAGTPLWSKNYDFGETDLLASMAFDRDQMLLLGGYSKNAKTDSGGISARQKTKEGIDDYILAKIDPAGEIMWDAFTGSDGEDVLKKVVSVRDGGYILAGTTMPNRQFGVKISKSGSRDKSYAHGNNDFWVVKLKDNKKTKEERIPIIALPNPAVYYSNIILSYDYTFGTATVYDLSGRMIQSFKIEKSRTIPIDLGGYAEGVYIVEIKTDVKTDSVKILKTL